MLSEGAKLIIDMLLLFVLAIIIGSVVDKKSRGFEDKK